MTRKKTAVTEPEPSSATSHHVSYRSHPSIQLVPTLIRGYSTEAASKRAMAAILHGLAALDKK
jgi:hypothetical protein